MTRVLASRMGDGWYVFQKRAFELERGSRVRSDRFNSLQNIEVQDCMFELVFFPGAELLCSLYRVSTLGRPTAFFHDTRCGWMGLAPVLYWACLCILT
jgi:hypothetical protein